MRREAVGDEVRRDVEAQVYAGTDPKFVVGDGLLQNLAPSLAEGGDLYCE